MEHPKPERPEVSHLPGTFARPKIEPKPEPPPEPPKPPKQLGLFEGGRG